MKHLSTALTMSAPCSNSTADALNHQFRTEMSGSILKMHDLMNGEQGSENGFRTWHSIWDLYSQYVASEQAMLNRRTALLVGYENANRNWDKAKNTKKDEVSLFLATFQIKLQPISVKQHAGVPLVVSRFVNP